MRWLWFAPTNDWNEATKALIGHKGIAKDEGFVGWR
jgi:hypothetical protein